MKSDRKSKRSVTDGNYTRSVDLRWPQNQTSIVTVGYLCSKVSLFHGSDQWVIKIEIEA